ncbi:MAG TPA: hypothetical protein PK788_12055 [Gemmatimonadaceae bacterium]|nr:hypothetical protein [Gemmatimonadaceae bacterium]
MLALMKPGLADLGLLTLAGAGTAGAVIGSVLYRTRLWARTYALQSLRLAFAGTIAGFVLSDLGVLTGLLDPASARYVLAAVPGVALAFVVLDNAFYHRLVSIRPERVDVLQLLAAAGGCLAWAALVLAMSPKGEQPGR